MKPLPRRLWREQLDLFQARPLRMTWTTLPTAVQREVKQLLARMLRQHLLRPDATAVEKEVSHE